MKLQPYCTIENIPYPGLRNIAIQRLNVHNCKKNSNYSPKEVTISSGFSWIDTPEGLNFWDNVYHGNYDGRFEKQILKRI